MDKETRLSKEVAEEQLGLFLDFYDVNPEDFGDEDQEKSIRSCNSKLIKGIRKGVLTIISEDGIVVLKQKVKDGSELKYSELSGKNKIATDAAKKEYAKMYAFLGSITGVGTTGIEKLKGVDLTLAEAIGTLLFLA